MTTEDKAVLVAGRGQSRYRPGWRTSAAKALERVNAALVQAEPVTAAAA